MKKLLFLLAICLILSPFIAKASFDDNLKYGSKGSSVKELQEFLTAQGYYSGPITGSFFSLTLKAVKSYQSGNSISPAYGYWGPMTRKVANTALDTEISNQTAQEKAETSTVTPPIVDPTVKDKIDTLNSQIKSLNDQLQTGFQTQQQLQQKIQDNTQKIAQNTAPAPVVVPVPEPAPQPFLKVYETVDTKQIPKDTINADIIANKSTDVVILAVKSFNENGVETFSDISVVTDNPDLPSNFTIKANMGFSVGDHHQSGIIQDKDGVTSCDSTLNMPFNYNDGCIPVSTGTFTFTFTNSELGVSKTIHLTIK